MFKRFIIPAALIASLGLNVAGGTYSWKSLGNKKDEVLHLREFCASFDLAPNFGTVERVVDGDTLKLTDGSTIRLLGPDTPEICHHTSSGSLRDVNCVEEPGGLAAKKFVEDLLTGEEIVFVGDDSIGSRDVFGRLLRYVYLQDRFVNMELIAEGYAPLYDHLQKKTRFYDDFTEAEESARVKKKGVWGDN